MNDFENIKKSATDRISVVRVRTWTLTLAIVVTLVLYFLVTIFTKNQMNWTDFVFLTLIQIMAHSSYFPDGELYGTKNERYIANKTEYNRLASVISKEQRIAKLREYCDYDYEQRKMRYIKNECGIIGITESELETLQEKSVEEIKELKKLTLTRNEKVKHIFLSKGRKKRLINLLFKDLPVEKNQPETIMSALENNGNRAIHDSSIGFKIRSYESKFATAILMGLILAFIGTKAKDGIGFAEIVKIVMYLCTLFGTSVMAYSSGEVCSRVHKSNFYLSLATFINGFNEWNITKE